jgi:hypothetical protein
MVTSAKSSSGSRRKKNNCKLFCGEVGLAAGCLPSVTIGVLRVGGLAGGKVAARGQLE